MISQRLVPRADGKGRVPALEVLVATARVRECIGDKDRTKELHDAIAKGFTTYGMQTFDQSLMQLVKQGLVTYEEALKHVSNPDDFALRFRGIASTSDGTWDDFEEATSEDEAQEKAPRGRRRREEGRRRLHPSASSRRASDSRGRERLEARRRRLERCSRVRCRCAESSGASLARRSPAGIRESP